MAKQEINIGINPNDGSGETLRSAGQKINENFSELYSIVGASGDITFVNSVTAGPGISLSATTGDIVVTNTSPYINSFNTVTVSGQGTVIANSTSQALAFVAGSNVSLTTNPTLNQVTITATQQPADWNAISGPTSVINKPDIPDPQVQADWQQSSNVAVDYIKNKPVIPTDVSQLSDSTGILPDGYRIKSFSETVAPSATTVVYTAIDAPTAINVTIRAAGTIGGLDVQAEVCQMFVVRSYPVVGDPDVAFTVGTPTGTTLSPLATYVAQWSTVNSAIEIVATNLNSGVDESLNVKVVAIEVLP